MFLMHQWENLFDDLSLSFIISGILVVAEILPFYLSLDWSTISILLTGMNDERQALLNPTLSPHVRIQTERRLTAVSKVFRIVVERASWLEVLVAAIYGPCPYIRLVSHLV